MELKEIREAVKKISLKYQDSNDGTATEILAVVAAFYVVDNLLDEAREIVEKIFDDGLGIDDERAMGKWLEKTKS